MPFEFSEHEFLEEHRKRRIAHVWDNLLHTSIFTFTGVICLIGSVWTGSIWGMIGTAIGMLLYGPAWVDDIRDLWDIRNELFK